MIRIYLSPRYDVGLNHTRNVLAQFINFPDGFDEMANVGRYHSLCVADTNSATHAAIVTDGRAVPFSPLYADKQALKSGLSIEIGDLDSGLIATGKARLETMGIDTSWITLTHTLKSVLRHVLSALGVEQRLTGESKIKVLTYLRRNLDTAVGDIPPDQRTAARDWILSKGLEVDWIIGSSTVREVVQYLADNFPFGKMYIAGEEF